MNISLETTSCCPQRCGPTFDQVSSWIFVGPIGRPPKLDSIVPKTFGHEPLETTPFGTTCCAKKFWRQQNFTFGDDSLCLEKSQMV